MATVGPPPGNPSDPIYGTALRDRLFGGSSDDRLGGLGGDDKIFGEAGKDSIVGGTGNDFLMGDGTKKATFADVFAFHKDSGRDVIADFQVGKDILQITKGLNGIKTADDVIDHAKQKGKDVIIDLGDGNKIKLNNVDLDDLKKHPHDHFQIH